MNNFKLFPALLASVLVVATIAFAYQKTRLAPPACEAMPFQEDVSKILAPPQDRYRADPSVRSALQLLSRRWNTNVENLYVLAAIKGDANALGIIDSHSWRSARMYVLNTEPSAKLTARELEMFGKQSVELSGNVILAEEFTPTSPLEIRIARMFYSSPMPAWLGKEGKTFAVIVGGRVPSSGDGKIVIFTSNGGFVTFPVHDCEVIRTISDVWVN